MKKLKPISDTSENTYRKNTFPGYSIMALTITLSNSYSNNLFKHDITGVSYTVTGAPSKEQSASPDNAVATGYNELTEEEKQQVKELKARDREVKAHEMAHIAAGGQYITGRANYEYQTGPDGKRYAVGGEVSIDTSEVNGDPEATIRKMQVVRRAALAPAKPSAQDRAVAAQATQKEINARQELREEKSAEDKEDLSPNKHSVTITASYTKTGKAIPFSNTLNSRLFDIIA